MSNTPNMTKEQRRELAELKRREKAALKSIDTAEVQIRKKITAAQVEADVAERQAVKEHSKVLKNIRSNRAKALKPLRTALARLQGGKAPETAELESVRRRIAILEGRLAS